MRGPATLVVIIDGTMSSLEPGRETNPGLMWKLLSDRAPGPDLALYYEPGIQFTRWRDLRDVIEGRGIDDQIRRAYGWLASRYRPGDRIFLFGYSRGAYAVRSLAGVIDRVGLLRREAATERAVQLAFRHYRDEGRSETAAAFARRWCHEDVRIDMIGAFDTVKALGLRLPVIWRWMANDHLFHDHALGPHIRRACHALALDETRAAYAPVMWDPGASWDGTCEQVWFRGSHGDVGGQLAGIAAARPLSNVPLVWMLERAEAAGLTLPEGWRARYGCDPSAPSVGQNVGMGRWLRSRAPRRVCTGPSERLHETAAVSRGAAP